MTNILCALMVLTVTNYSSMGTFTDKQGHSFDVQQGTRYTNTVAMFDFEGESKGFVLKSLRGDPCCEDRVPIPPPDIVIATNNPAMQWYMPTPTFTNIWVNPLNLLTNNPNVLLHSDAQSSSNEYHRLVQSLRAFTNGY